MSSHTAQFTKLRYSIVIQLLALLLVALPAMANWSTVRQVEGASRVLAEVDGNKRAYWSLDLGASMSMMVTGPAEIRVISRSIYKSSYKGDPYTLSWSLDGDEGGTMEHKIIKSRAARIADGGKKLSASQTDMIEVPPGTHRLELTADSCPDDAVIIRLRKKFIHPIPRGGNIDILPLSVCPARDVVVRETINTYHVLKSGEELELDVIGPTFMKVISRLDWNSSMSGRQKYMLKVYEDDAFKNTWVLQGRQSDLAVYTGKTDSVPARGEVIYVGVPEGRHKYKIRFQDSGRELNLRFLIPRESLRNEE